MANKYLDNTGLSRMWTRIKSYLSSNYATKSALNSGLAGKANSSHTHTTSQITNLASYVDGRIDNKLPSSSGPDIAIKDMGIDQNTTGAKTYTVPRMSVGDLYFCSGYANARSGSVTVKLPSGGTYLVWAPNNPSMNTYYTQPKDPYSGTYSGGSVFYLGQYGNHDDGTDEYSGASKNLIIYRKS